MGTFNLDAPYRVTVSPPRSAADRSDLAPAERRELAALIGSSPRPPRPGANARPHRAAPPSAGLELVEREQLAALGHLERLPAPSSNPLTTVDVVPRAVSVLLALGENPRRVGEALLNAPPTTAAHRARAEVLRARRAIAPAALHLDTRRRARLATLVPHERPRWTLLLRASGAFPVVDEIASVLGVDRATAYRDLARAAAALTTLCVTAKTGRRP